MSIDAVCIVLGYNALSIRKELAIIKQTLAPHVPNECVATIRTIRILKCSTEDKLIKGKRYILTFIRNDSHTVLFPNCQQYYLIHQPGMGNGWTVVKINVAAVREATKPNKVAQNQKRGQT
jgi:hypothetical protein